MPDEVKSPAPVERRLAALERAFEERNLIPAGFIDDFVHIAQEDWVPPNGARVVARAWTDPQAADPATVHVGVFESYLERAP